MPMIVPILRNGNGTVQVSREIAITFGPVAVNGDSSLIQCANCHVATAQVASQSENTSDQLRLTYKLAWSA